MDAVLSWTLFILVYLVTLWAAGHALLNKRDPTAAFAWVVGCLLLPGLGALWYFLFGINRIQTRAQKLQVQSAHSLTPGVAVPGQQPEPGNILLPQPLKPIQRLSDAVTGQLMVGGNRIQVLHNGEETFPAMLEAIHKAQSRVLLTTYIFETNTTGRQFLDALEQAVRRGVDVRVIIDGIGELYDFPRASTQLRKRGVPVIRFLPTRLFPPLFAINLRNHRKVLMVDGVTGFTGGMNIGDRHLAADQDNPDRVIDIHFQVDGPIVAQLEHVFLQDWAFLTGDMPVPSEVDIQPRGSSFCRTILDGPDEHLNKLTTILVGAVAQARERVCIMTPYFLPPRELTAALQAAALRGVEVQLILPGKNNLPFVHWATRHMLIELLSHGVQIYYQPPPFVHSKLFVVDQTYAQIGSANIDPRSLRLNFELTIEVIDPVFAATLLDHFEACRIRSHALTEQELNGRSLPARIRDAVAWLFYPYL